MIGDIQYTKDLSYILSKSTFLRGSQCVKSLYLNRFQKDLSDPTDESTQARFESGKEVGKLAQQLFPGGSNSNFFEDLNADRAVERTLQLINDDTKIIYEAAFIYDLCLVIMDILVRDKGQWKAFEVKSSTSVKDEHIIDASYQYYVIKNAGIDIEDVSIIYINNKYIRQDELSINELFSIQSVIELAKGNLEKIKDEITKFKAVLNLMKFQISK